MVQAEKRRIGVIAHTALFAVGLATCLLFGTGCASGVNGPEQPASPSPAEEVESAEPSESAPEGIPASALVSAQQLHDLIAEGAPMQLVDLRALYAYDAGAIFGSVSMPAGSQFEVRCDELSKEKPVYLIDADGKQRVAEAWDILLEKGFSADKLHVLEGGMDAWAAAGYSTKPAVVPRC